MLGRGRGEVVVVVGQAEVDTAKPFRSVKEAVVVFGERVLAEKLAAGRKVDTTKPFRSVKEAVLLFGERILAENLSAGHQLSVNQNQAAATRPNHHAVSKLSITAGAITRATPRPVPPVTAELAVVKQELKMEQEDMRKMALCIQSLQEELSHVTRELKRLKARDEGLSFTKAEKKPVPARGSADGVAAAAGGELQKKRHVTFADPPMAATAGAVTTATPRPVPPVTAEFAVAKQELELIDTSMLMKSYLGRAGLRFSSFY